MQGDNDSEIDKDFEPKLIVNLPPHKDAEVLHRAVEMRYIREEALTAANVRTDFRRPITKITMLNVSVSSSRKY